jgi:hypothetical protein
MTAGTIVLYAAIMLWGLICGACVYEHVAVIPVWASNPPESLAMWHGRYRLVAERFWMAIHPLTLLALGGALALNWSTPGRDLLAMVLGAYVVVIIAPTAAWYVPELMKLTRDDKADIPPASWRTRAKRWEVLSLVRGALVLALLMPLVRAAAMLAGAH